MSFVICRPIYNTHTHTHTHDTVVSYVPTTARQGVAQGVERVTGRLGGCVEVGR